MAITPQTDLYLIKSTLELDNSNQLTFNSKEAQYDYFMSLPKIGVDNFTYQRKDNVIRYPEHIDNIIEYNYVVYRNDAYTDKIFYAYIDRMEYINDKMTLIYIKTDVFQTWQFDIEYKSSFVEREHVNNDTRGLHTIPEGLETGDYIHNGNMVKVSLVSTDTSSNIPAINQAHVVVGSTVALASSTNLFGNVTGNRYGGIYSGVRYYVFETDSDINNMLSAIAEAGKSDNIITMFMAPDFLTQYGAGTWNTVTYRDITYKCKPISTSSTAVMYDLGRPITIPKAYSLNGYTPKNNKLLTGEYMYLYVSNFNGSESKYDYELFTNSGAVTSNDCAFQIRGSLTPSCSIELYPSNYQTLDTFDSGIYSIPAGKLPMCNWNQDQYTNWLTQNGVNNISRVVSSTAIGAVSGGVGGAVAGAGEGIFNVLSQMYQHTFDPNASKGNTNNGDVAFSSAHVGYGIYPMSIKAEYARVIDDFFSAYGYKVNSYKVPNITGRRNWNYVKTIGANIEGYLPQEDIQELKSMFNSGVTLWHNPSTFLDYSQNNAII